MFKDLEYKSQILDILYPTLLQLNYKIDLFIVRGLCLFLAIQV